MVQTEGPRAMRSDARDNRARIIAVATDLIEEQGTMASLNEITKRSGVGPGTLYRHFPTREALLAEVLTTWVARVRAAADSMVISSKEDLVDWLERLTGISNAYRGLAASIASSENDGDSPLRSAHQTTLDAIDQVFDQGRALRLFDGVVDAGTVGRLVTGVAMATEQANLTHEQTRAMLAVILDGILATAESTPEY